MRKTMLLILSVFLVSCNVEELHKYTVISNDYKDTSVVWASRVEVSFKSNNVRLTGNNAEYI